jgi:hypothetical protein
MSVYKGCQLGALTQPPFNLPTKNDKNGIPRLSTLNSYCNKDHTLDFTMAKGGTCNDSIGNLYTCTDGAWKASTTTNPPSPAPVVVVVSPAPAPASGSAPAPTVSIVAPTPAPAPAPIEDVQKKEQENEESSGGGNTMLIVIVLILLLLGGGAAFFFMKKPKAPSSMTAFGKKLAKIAKGR